MNEIIDIVWERANIILTLKNPLDKEPFLVADNKKIKLEYENNVIKFNITNIPAGKALEEGHYYIEVAEGKLKLNKNLLEQLDDKSRIFKYRTVFALLISFDTDMDYIFYLDANYMKKNKSYHKFYQLAEGENIKKKITILFKKLSLVIINVLYKIIYKLNYKQNRVLFLTENSNFLHDNLKYLYEEYSKKYNTSIFARDLYKTKSRYIYEFKEIIAIAKARYIFVDNYVSLMVGLKVDKTQVITQLWHAGIGFKAVGYARFGKVAGPHPFVSAHRKYTNAFVDNPEMIDIYREVFGVSKDIFVASGMPRIENYLDREVIDKKVAYLKEEIPQLENKKIILFAPTYRGLGSKDAYYDYTKLDLDKIYDFCLKNNFLFLLKMHPFIKDKIRIAPNYQDTILEVSDYNINDLIYITDILITDYSSCCYEYSFFNRPLIFYRYDKEIYEYLRPMHTLSLFTDKNFEVTNFADLMARLEMLRNVKISDRFKEITKRNLKSCDIIENEVFKSRG